MERIEVINTCYFKSQTHAECYYAIYGYTATDVARKLMDSEIRIRYQGWEAGALFRGHRVVDSRLIDNGCRWQVTVYMRAMAT